MTTRMFAVETALHEGEGDAPAGAGASLPDWTSLACPETDRAGICAASQAAGTMFQRAFAAPERACVQARSRPSNWTDLRASRLKSTGGSSDKS